jgi:hypothetical protein
MKWETLAHAIAEPTWAAGGLLIARRAGEAALPVSKRLGTAIVAALPTAILTGSASLFGGWIALDARLTRIEREHLEVVSMIRERTTLREQQMHEFTSQLGTILARMTMLESRQRDCDLTLAEIRALHRQETGRK